MITVVGRARSYKRVLFEAKECVHINTNETREGNMMCMVWRVTITVKVLVFQDGSPHRGRVSNR